MLLWRIVSSAILIAILAAACWLDHLAPTPGLFFFPLGCVLVVLASAELMQLLKARDLRTLAGVVYGGNVLLLAGSWFPVLWHHLQQTLRPTATSLGVSTLACLVICLSAAFFGVMCRFQKPGHALNTLAATVFAVVYLGLTFSFLAQLRFLWGMKALVSLILVVKLGDSGAYAIGRLVGRHKITPVLSPGKTWEGTIGALVFAGLGGWLSFLWIAPAANSDLSCACGRWILYGVLLGLAGIFGDLAESLLKRDAAVKDSSTWLPGLGGVLDILDSLLLAAPVAWFCWIVGLVQQ
ncbi:MAG: phosphatidate cytidylyltransferase [Pirellulales bacterium]|nr:phosphatidate cytidylyltransferase [Pirellulales bacterium]